MWTCDQYCCDWRRRVDVIGSGVKKKVKRSVIVWVVISTYHFAAYDGKKRNIVGYETFFLVILMKLFGFWNKTVRGWFLDSYCFNFNWMLMMLKLACSRVDWITSGLQKHSEKKSQDWNVETLFLTKFFSVWLFFFVMFNISFFQATRFFFMKKFHSKTSFLNFISIIAHLLYSLVTLKLTKVSKWN